MNQYTATKAKFYRPSKLVLSLCLPMIIGFSSQIIAADTMPSVPTTRVIQAAPDNMALGRAAVAANNWRRAIDEFTLAVKNNAENADAHNMLAYSLRKQARPNLAKSFEHYGIALKLDPRHKGAHNYIGVAYLMDGKPELAKPHLAALESICGKQCEEYSDLARAMAAYKPDTPFSSAY